MIFSIINSGKLTPVPKRAFNQEPLVFIMGLNESILGIITT